MSARIISIANMKGGVGKTTIGLHLAACLAINKKYKVLYLDCDFQESAADYRRHEKNNVYGEDTPPPYDVEQVMPKYIFPEVKANAEKYDIIMIDIPRITNSSDNDIVSVLAVCDSILIPFTAGELEGLSFLRFIDIVKNIHEFRKSKELDFTFFGFLNMEFNSNDNKNALPFMEKQGIPTFENSLRRVTALKRISTYESILATKEGKTRFEAFFNEFLEKFNF